MTLKYISQAVEVEMKKAATLWLTRRDTEGQQTLTMEKMQVFLLDRKLHFACGKCSVQITTLDLESRECWRLAVSAASATLAERWFRKSPSGERKKDLGGIWAEGKDQNIHIDRKSPPLALAWALIRVTVHITLEILGAASAAAAAAAADRRADLCCFYIAV